MNATLSILKLTSAMARHAGHQHAVTADNLARADVPGATSKRAEAFAAAVERGPEAAPRITDTGRSIALEEEMLGMAEASGRHEAALSAWKSTLNLMRLALSRPE